MRTNVHHLIEHRARSHPAAPALTVKNQTIGYGELWTSIRGAAAGLSSLGVTAEQRVAVYLDKRVETVAAVFGGASAAGGVFVPVNPLLRSAQVRHILVDCAVTVLVTSPERWALLRGGDLETCPDLEHVVVVGALPDDPPPCRYAVHPWEGLCTPRGAYRAPRRSISTWPRSSTRRGVPEGRKVWC